MKKIIQLLTLTQFHFSGSGKVTEDFANESIENKKALPSRPVSTAFEGSKEGHSISTNSKINLSFFD